MFFIINVTSLLLWSYENLLIPFRRFFILIRRALFTNLFIKNSIKILKILMFLLKNKDKIATCDVITVDLCKLNICNL